MAAMLYTVIREDLAMEKKFRRYLSLLVIALLLTGCGKEAAEVMYPDFEMESGEEAQQQDDGTDQESEGAGEQEDTPEYDGNLIIEDGCLQPMLTYTYMRDPSFSNEYSDILRFCVYVETDHDTDDDGLNDLVKVFVQVPKGAVEGKFKAGTIYDPTPYNVGVVEANMGHMEELYLEKEFDYKELYQKGTKREVSDTMTTMDAALLASPDKDWNYFVPGGSTGYVYSGIYDYYLIRGYAVVQCCGIGTYGSQGYELVGTDLERDSHKCVVEWLTGDRVAFTDTTGNIEIKADWSNGNVAMTGASYGGTIPYEVATTGVKGLKTIIPFAGIADWYEYTNSQGVVTYYNPHYSDLLSAYNCGGLYMDNDWLVLNPRYRSWLWQITQDQAKANGNYAPIWDELNYAYDYEKINCSALIVQGLNDFNVTSNQANHIYKAFKQAGQNTKLVLHQNGHDYLYSYLVGEELWLEIENKWLAHYLYDVDNGIENMPEITVQSNVDGSFHTYDSFGDQELKSFAVTDNTGSKVVTSDGVKEFIRSYHEDKGITTENMDMYFLELPEGNSAVYDIAVPEDTTISGVPEVHVKLTRNTPGEDDFMVSAILLDVREDGEQFEAYMLRTEKSDLLPVHTIMQNDNGSNLESSDIYEYVKSLTPAKLFTFGWTDLFNPGCGPDPREYTKQEGLETGKEYDYTFYMLPTVYTIEKGHKLKLVLTTWDPYRKVLDDNGDYDSKLVDKLPDTNYSFTINNSAIDVRLPVLDK